MTATPPKPTTPPKNGARAPGYMSLVNATKGVRPRLLKDVLYGPEKIGKSSWAAQAPRPIFLGAVRETRHIDVFARLPEPRNWRDLLDGIGVVLEEKHEGGTLVLDPLDWLEALIWREVLREHADEHGQHPKTIEGYGYGKGYTTALDYWRKLLAALDHLQERRGMHILLLAHAKVATFKNPSGPDYDRWSMKLNDKAAALVSEWAESIFFASYEDRTVGDKLTRKTKAITTGKVARIMHTQRSASWNAGTRHPGMPPTLPLNFRDFFALVSRTPAEVVARLRAEFDELIAALPESRRETARKGLDAAGDNATRLEQGLNIVRLWLADEADAEAGGGEVEARPVDEDAGDVPPDDAPEITPEVAALMSDPAPEPAAPEPAKQAAPNGGRQSIGGA